MQFKELRPEQLLLALLRSYLFGWGGQLFEGHCERYAFGREVDEEAANCFPSNVNFLGCL